jgi:hypothetical protein
MNDLRGKAEVIYFSWEGSDHQPLYLAFLGGLKALISRQGWDAGSFQVRWQRLGRLIH